MIYVFIHSFNIICIIKDLHSFRWFVSDLYKNIAVAEIVNPFPNTPFWDRPKFKEAADNNWNVVIKGF